MRGAASLEEIIGAEVRKVTDKLLPAIQAAISETASARPAKGPAVRRGRTLSRRRRRAEDLTRWVADKRARRVPLFVIEMTGGLDTKKGIQAKYGEDATFEKGKPLPPVKPSGAKSAVMTEKRETAAHVVSAKAPVIRKRGAK